MKASISKIGSSKIIGGANTYDSYTVTWTGLYAGHSAEDRRYDVGYFVGEHEICDIITD